MALIKEEIKLKDDNLKTCYVTDKKVNFAFLPKDERAQIKNFLTNKTLEDTLHKQSRKQTCPLEYCNGSIMGVQNLHENRNFDQIILEAEDFLNQYFTFNKKANTDEHKFRLEEIKKELNETKTINYTHEELMFGARTAWRNASRCIGRIQWNKLYLNDCRNIKSTKEMFEGVCKHIEYSTNNGNLRSTITLFPQRIPFREDWLLWNSQLISFAGYQQEDGTVLGDPINVEFTNTCLKLGWIKPQIDRTQFDILPLIFSGPGEMPTIYEIPKELILLVDIRHPTNPFLDDLNLKWYAVPAVSGMLFDVGGIQFPSAPFNGWYMGTEIAARDFLDPSRYNLSRKLARRLNLNTSNSVNLWLDRVSLEMNIAVLHSFQSKNVTIVDHHTASESFIKHLETETKLRGGCPADWVWITPPMSSSLTKVFHQEMFNYHLKPSYEYQKPHSKTYDWKRQAIELKYKLKSVAMSVLFSNLMQKITLRKRPTATILYATETGVSESFALKLNKLLKATFNCRVICMENYNLKELADEKILLFVTSTFGNGEAPDNGKSFWDYVSSLQANDVDFSKLNYSVFALGSSQYSTFCEFGKNLDKTFLKLGAKQIVGVGLGDELKGQEKIFGKFSLILFKNMCKEFNIEFVENNIQIENEVFNPGKVRLIETDNNEDEEPIYKKLRSIHNKPINSYNIISTTQLLPAESDHKVLLVKLTPNKKQNDEFTFDYKPGDHLAVIPANSEKLVNKILNKLKPDTVGMYQDDIQNTIYKIEVQSNGKWQSYTKIPECTLREALTNYFDISGPPSLKFLASILNFIKDDLERQNLAKIISDQKTYEDWKHCYCPNIGDLFDLFPSLKIGPKILFTQLNILQPRYYSISSTLDASPNEVHLTMTLVEFKSQDKKSATKHGLCTNYFAENPKNLVNCFLPKVSSFNMPKSLDTPVILISAGSGIAPFRSFWMQSEFNQKNLSKGNKIFLFFGCRRTRIDNIFGSEFPSLLKKGVILDIFYAYSRDSQHKKRYVQDQVYKQKKLVHFLLEKENAHIYVCGNSKMASGVKHAVKKVLEEEGNLNDHDADTYLSKLFNDGRYHEDVFSSTHQTKKIDF